LPILLYSIKDANVNRQHNLTEQITEQTTKQNKNPGKSEVQNYFFWSIKYEGGLNEAAGL